MLKKITKVGLNALWKVKRHSYVPRIIYYHEVDPINELCHKPAAFRFQMQWLFDHGYSCPTLSQFNQFRQQDKVIFITFDDGYSGNFEYAVPILQEFDFKATFFVCSDYIDQDVHQVSVNGHKLYKNLQMLNAENLVKMYNCGMEIGSHGASHRMMSRLTHQEQYEELYLSKEKLEALIGCQIVSYSYPNGQRGAVSDYANIVAKQMGYKYICSTLWGDCKKTQIMLNRCDMSHEDSMRDFIAKITGKRDYRKYLDRLMDKSKIWERT